MRMSKMFIVPILLLIIAPCCKNEGYRIEEAKSQIVFSKEIINIGKFKSGSKQDIIFYGLNPSETPLIIDTLQASCACTIGEFSKEPILKNDSGSIVVTFNPKAGVYGYFKKSVVVSANTKPAFTVLSIEGEIVP
jgi:hypothetical protein